MEIIELEHGSNEWLEFRNTGIGGSDAAAIVGASPYKTNTELWEEKTGLKISKDIKDNPAVEYGKNAEDFLVKIFELDYPEYEVAICKTKVYKRGFMFASLDGELTEKGTKRRGILEIKTSAPFAYTSKEKWNNRIPNNYYVQILHYLIVTGWDFVKVKAQLKSTDENGETYLITKHYHFERKELLEDLRYLYLKEKQFWGYVERKERPALLLPTLTRQN